MEFRGVFPSQPLQSNTSLWRWHRGALSRSLNSCMVRSLTKPGAEMPVRRGQLEYFVAVAEQGQMTSAARRLGIAQPALSQSIAQLEADLGLKLLDRHPRGVTLTAAGEAFYAKARLAVAASVEADSAAPSPARGHRGAIDFGF